MLTQIITADAASAQQDRTRTGLADNAGPDLPVPLEVSVRFERSKSTLYKLCDYALDREQRLRRVGDDAGADQALRRYEIIWDEIDRREAIAAEKEHRRQARMRTAAAIFHEIGQVRT